MPTTPTKLALTKIRTDGGTQPRSEIDADTVAQYRERMEEGDKFPPVVTYFDGTDYWLADGFHRVDAAKAAGWKTIDADVRQGTRREAILHSVGANSDHGRPRSNADKRRAVTTVLTNELVCKNEAGKDWSDSAIARLCAVSHTFVANMRSELSCNGCKMERTAIRNGKEYTINRDAYLDMLEEVYNFGRKKLVPIKIEAIQIMRERNAVSAAKKKKAA